MEQNKELISFLTNKLEEMLSTVDRDMSLYVNEDTISLMDIEEGSDLSDCDVFTLSNGYKLYIEEDYA